MKRIITIAILALTGILGVGSALAQSDAVRVKVPFAFTAGNRLLPAGNYLITSLSADVIHIQARDQHFSVITTEMQDDRQSKDGDELIFVRYGDRYFLREILCNSAAMNVSLPTTKSEEWARHQEASVQHSDLVLLASK
jgi:hypothetical protein